MARSSIFLCRPPTQGHRPGVSLLATHARHRCRQGRGLGRWQLFERRAQHLIEQRGQLGRLRGGCRLRRTGDHERDFPFLPERIRTGSRGQIGQLTAINLLVNLGQFTRHSCPTRGPENSRQIGQRLANSVRCFEEHQGTRLLRQRLETLPALPRARRQKPFETKSIGGDPGDRQGGGDRSRPWNAAHLETLCSRLAHQSKPRVGQQRSPGIAHEHERSTRGQLRQHLAQPLALVVRMQRPEGFFEAKQGQQLTTATRILGKHQIGTGERLTRPRRQVAEIADGRGHDLETPERMSRPLLLARHYNSVLSWPTARGILPRRIDRFNALVAKDAPSMSDRTAHPPGSATGRTRPAAPLILSLLLSGLYVLAGCAGPGSGTIERETAREGVERADEIAARAAATAGAAAARRASNAHVAVLLPLSGRQATAGRQLRDGLLAGFYATDPGQRIPLRFYDTQGLPITAALQTAAEAGAVFVIGPLAREEVGAAADDPRSLPTLALNFLPAERQAPRPDFYQFALSPEDEARAIARQALAQGQRRAVAFVPAGDWGDRVLLAFESALRAGGGTVLARASLGGNDEAAAMEQALRLDQSRARHRRLQSVLDTALAFQPRRRSDIDLLFVPGGRDSLRQWRPQLRFYGAADIPTYTTSDAWDGQGSSELAGLLFPDTRWMLGADDTATITLRQSARVSFGAEHETHRLFAFGHDAWLLQQRLRLTPPASRPTGLTVEGAVGQLTLDADGRVGRSLDWAQITEDGLRRLDPRAP